MASSKKKVWLFTCVAFMGGCSFASIDTAPKAVSQTAKTPVTAKTAQPTVETQVITKTVTVTKAIPDSCKQAYKILGDIEPYDSVIASSAGQTQDMLSLANERIVAKDFAAVNKSIASGIIIKDRLDTAVVAKSTSVLSFQSSLKQCDEDMK